MHKIKKIIYLSRNFSGGTIIGIILGMVFPLYPGGYILYIVAMLGVFWGSALGERIGGHPGSICGAILGLIFPTCFYILITSTIGGFIGYSFEKLLFKIINLFRKKLII